MNSSRRSTALYLAAALCAHGAAPTFNRDVAPILFKRCTPCHRPGQPGPFPLLTYIDAAKRAKEIADVTTRKYMPPWLPESERGEFVGDRRLTDSEIRTIKEWYEGGTAEGSAADLPPAPKWEGDWSLGKPDLIVQLPKPYNLGADGRDVYRNFVIPTPLSSRKVVRAVEFRPENPKIVHHAFIKVDYRGNARRLDGQDGQPGFGGMGTPDGVKMPQGYFLSWQPGKTAAFEPPGFGWALEPDQDLVLQTHLRPSGKPEELQAQIGIYFTDVPLRSIAFTFALTTLSIDIPAGDTHYTVEDNLTLPVDADVVAVLPHAHYLAKRLEGSALLPDGSTKRLLLIPRWDFNWQGDYRYTTPIHLPAGSQLRMRYTYDNSAENPENPNKPPKEVLYGPQSSDEMAELWFQVELRSSSDRDRLAEAYNSRMKEVFTAYDVFRLKKNPKDARARTSLGRNQFMEGHSRAAIETLRIAASDDPAYDEPHYYLGLIFRSENRMPQAQSEFETSIRLNPGNGKAHANLGIVLAEIGELDQAEAHLKKAVELDPGDATAAATLEEFKRARATQGVKK